MLTKTEGEREQQKKQLSEEWQMQAQPRPTHESMTMMEQLWRKHPKTWQLPRQPERYSIDQCCCCW